jgi:hypothetical protein
MFIWEFSWVVKNTFENFQSILLNAIGRIHDGDLALQGCIIMERMDTSFQALHWPRTGPRFCLGMRALIWKQWM